MGGEGKNHPGMGQWGNGRAGAEQSPLQVPSCRSSLIVPSLSEPFGWMVRGDAHWLCHALGPSPLTPSHATDQPAGRPAACRSPFRGEHCHLGQRLAGAGSDCRGTHDSGGSFHPAHGDAGRSSKGRATWARTGAGGGAEVFGTRVATATAGDFWQSDVTREGLRPAGLARVSERTRGRVEAGRQRRERRVAEAAGWVCMQPPAPTSSDRQERCPSSRQPVGHSRRHRKTRTRSHTATLDRQIALIGKPGALQRLPPLSPSLSSPQPDRPPTPPAHACPPSTKSP